MSFLDNWGRELSLLQEKLLEQKQYTEAFFEEKLPEVQSALDETIQATTAVLSENSPKVQEVMSKLICTIKENAETVIKKVQTRNNTMKHKILMMGGRRAGKSTILASILHSLKNSPGDLCTIADLTDYSQKILGEDGKEYDLPSLDDKRREVVGYLQKMSEKASFLVDLTPTTVYATYTLRVNTTYKDKENKIRQTNIDLDFVDVPGEWMRKGVREHEKLVNEVKEADVIVIAIDTPYMMQEDEYVNEIYNRIPEITDTLEHLSIENDADRKQIIFCPVKCERWARQKPLSEVAEPVKEPLDEVAERVKRAYKNLINRWVQFQNVQIWIMPIQTVGALEFVNHREAKLYFKDENDSVGTLCSEDELTGVITDRWGNIVDEYDKKRGLESDTRWKIDYINIPVSWYKICGRELTLKDCEQPGYHILRFLVQKEDNVNKTKAMAESNQLSELEKELFGSFRVWLKKIFNPTFGEYLPIWKEVILRLDTRKLIKESGNGFMKITHPIQ